jgi:hypothetical protein
MKRRSRREPRGPQRTDYSLMASGIGEENGDLAPRGGDRLGAGFDQPRNVALVDMRATDETDDLRPRRARQ